VRMRLRLFPGCDLLFTTLRLGLHSAEAGRARGGSLTASVVFDSQLRCVFAAHHAPDDLLQVLQAGAGACRLLLILAPCLDVYGGQHFFALVLGHDCPDQGEHMRRGGVVQPCERMDASFACHRTQLTEGGGPCAGTQGSGQVLFMRSSRVRGR